MTMEEKSLQTDVLVVGSGAAGLMSALQLPPSLQVTIVAKKNIKEGSTNWAQGGIACVVDPEDSFSSHREDTHYAGDGLCISEAVKVLVEDGPACIEYLQKFMDFDSRSNGELRLGHEGAHSHRRILHAGGDATGREIHTALMAAMEERENLKVIEDHRLLKLLVEDGTCHGALLLDRATRVRLKVTARAVVLATGGLSQIYQESTNPKTSTGDGIAVAYEAGALIRDPEFVQFHPTALFIAGAPRFLISEAVRGEGAILRNSNGDAFMKEEHSMAELAPRDVVSRAIAREMIRLDDGCVFLDLSHLNADKITRRFPNILKWCKRFDIDITKQWIPVRPAAHYSMGGVQTDLHGQTNIRGLYANGEVASTGVHGANRLASNSLLEALVFSKRTAEHIKETELAPHRELDCPAFQQGDREIDCGDLIRTLRSQMWRRVGVFRTEEQMIRVHRRLNSWMRMELPARGEDSETDDFRSLLYCSMLVTQGALERRESRGAHHREDFPRRDDERFMKHTVLQYPIS